MKFLILFLFLTNVSEARTFVNELDDFYLHMDNHVRNVETLGMHLVDKLKSDKKLLQSTLGITEDIKWIKMERLIKEGLRLHDQSKINSTTGFANKHKSTRPIIEELYTIYSKPGFSKDAKSIVDNLNRVDEEVLQSFFKRNNMSATEKKLFLKIEELADKTERGMNAVTSEEMGRKATKGSVYLKGKVPDSELKLLTWLEDEYPKVATDFKSHKLRMEGMAKRLKKKSPHFRKMKNISVYELVREAEVISEKRFNPRLVNNGPKWEKRIYDSIQKNSRSKNYYKAREFQNLARWMPGSVLCFEKALGRRLGGF